jgi:hypothetical protein
MHRRCTSGQVEAAFGVKRVVLLQGVEAMRRVAEGLDEAADVDLVKQARTARRMPLQGVPVPDVQRPMRKAQLR